MAKQKLHQWEVASHSSSEVYKVTEYDDGSWACSCPRWKFAKAPKMDCKHILGTTFIESGGKLETIHVAPVAAKPQPITAPIVKQTRRVIWLE